MIARIFYALGLCWEYRKTLRNYAQDPKLQLPTILQLQRAQLEANGVRALILDYDGVLAAHGELEPLPEVVIWLKNLGNFPIFILSNKPLPERDAYFKREFPAMTFVIAPRKKPYPDGVQEIIRSSNLNPGQIMLLDDRLATGIVLAISTGLQARFITKPYTDFAKRPLRESGMMLLRWLERAFLALI